MFDLAILKIKEGTGIYAPGQERVVKILETTLDILIDAGFSAVTMREIARRMGIRVGAIQHYYATREDLVLDMLAGVLNSYEALFERFRKTSGETSEICLQEFIDAILDDIATLKTSRLFPELWVLASRDQNVARMLDAIYVRSRSLVIRLIAEINPALDRRTIETLAVFVTASLEGLTIFAGHGRVWAGEMDNLKAIARESLLSAVRQAKPLASDDPAWCSPTLLGRETWEELNRTDKPTDR